MLESFYTTEYTSKYCRPMTVGYSTRSINGGSGTGVMTRSITEPIQQDTPLDPFYTSEYIGKYRPPRTRQVKTRSVSLDGSELPPGTAGASEGQNNGPKKSGYSSNAHVSSLLLNKLDDNDQFLSTSHAHHSKYSTIFTLMEPRPTVQSTMERSGYWNEPEPGAVTKTPAQRSMEMKTRDIQSAVPPNSLKILKRKNPVEAENGGKGPEWGSTTTGSTYVKHESNHDRYWKTNRDLIGKKEADSFTRQHLTINQPAIVDQISTTHDTYRHPPVRGSPVIPNRTAIEQSGYTYSQIPTSNKTRPLSDKTAADLHPTEVARLKRVNTPEYQNLYNPDPWVSTHQISFQPQPKTRSVGTAIGPTRRGISGFCTNETVTAGAPGDARMFETGISEMKDKYRDPHIKLRSMPQLTANVVERSGYWGNDN